MEIFFFNDTATTEIYTLSLHDALPISPLAEHRQGLVLERLAQERRDRPAVVRAHPRAVGVEDAGDRSEEHTSELQSRQYLVCRLLLEKKNTAHADVHDRNSTRLNFSYA